jgi:hypothetical protein
MIMQVINKNELKLNFCKKISKNMYFYIYFFFKYSLLKKFITNNYKVLLSINQINLYRNVKECRFFFLFYYFLLKNCLYEIIKNLFNNALIKEKNESDKIIKLEWWEKPKINIDMFIDDKHIYFYNNVIYVFIIILFFNFKWILYFTKLKYYKNKNLFSKIFFYNEFVLKIDYNNFFLYRKYIDYLKIVKYNEYLVNNRLLHNLPKLKYFLRYSINKIELDKSYRKNIMLFSFFIYKIQNFDDVISYENVDHSLNKNSFLFNLRINYNLVNKWINNYGGKNELYLMRGLVYSKLLKFTLNNEFINFKLINNNIFKLLNFFNPFIYYKFFEIFKLLLSVYIAYISYEVHHKYILLDKKLRRFKCKYLKFLHWKYNNLKFKFLNFFYKILYRFNIKYQFNINILLNYGFLSFYYLENNKFIHLFLKKNILLYRILNLVIVKWSYLLFDHVHWELNKNAHVFKNLKNPDVQKAWRLNYIRRFERNQLISPFLNSNYYNKEPDLFLKTKPTLELNNKIKLNKFNFIFNFLWTVFYKLSCIKFIDIINNNKFYIDNVLLDSKYSIELIFWEIINSNNNYYNNYKYFLNFNKIKDVIKINNILSLYLTQYYNSILFYLVKYNKDFFINVNILSLFFLDFFSRIFFKKNYKRYVKIIIKNNLSLYYKIKLNYLKYFFWQVNSYLYENRFKNYFIINKIVLYDEYKFFFSKEYIKELQSVLKEFKVIKKSNE